MPFPVHSRALPWFPKAEDKAFVELGRSCLYAIGAEGATPLRIGWAFRPADRLAEAALWHWRPLVVHELRWVQGSLGQRLERECHRLLDKAGRRRAGDWFDVPPAMVCDLFGVAIANLRLDALTHDAMIDAVHARHAERIRRQVAAAGPF